MRAQIYICVANFIFILRVHLLGGFGRSPNYQCESYLFDKITFKRSR